MPLSPLTETSTPTAPVGTSTNSRSWVVLPGITTERFSPSKSAVGCGLFSPTRLTYTGTTLSFWGVSGDGSSPTDSIYSSSPCLHGSSHGKCRTSLQPECFTGQLNARLL